MEFVSGNIMIRPMILEKAGSVVQGHKHTFDHTSIVFTGSVRVKAVLPNGRALEQDFSKASHFLVLAGVEHEITALEDGTIVWCVYSHRDPQGDVIQQHIGWSPAYG